MTEKLHDLLERIRNDNAIPMEKVESLIEELKTACRAEPVDSPEVLCDIAVAALLVASLKINLKGAGRAL